MSMSTFHLFPSLPFELRREIYILATLPRIVHVREDLEESYEEFKEFWRTTPVQVNLDPSLTHFAFNWSKVVRFGQTRQRTLEDFGFSSSKSPRPWGPSASTPEIPLHWLSEHPEVAWELTRRSSLYSNAPIPALLHTCSESRNDLISRGYELAFRTRSSGPRTWFNFKRDVLFLQFTRQDGHRLLSGSPWDVGQFDPGDMAKVRKLALEESAGCLKPYNPTTMGEDKGPDQELTSVARLFGSLERLLLVHWTSEHISSWVPIDALKEYHKSKDRPWKFIAVEDIDALMHMFPPKDSWFVTIPPTGESCEFMRAHKQRNSKGSAGFFKNMSCYLEHRMTKEMECKVSANTDASIIAPWKIPRVAAVHCLPQIMIDFLTKKRRKTMKTILMLKIKMGLISGFEEALLDSDYPEIPDDRCHHGQVCDDWNCGETRWRNREIKWWAQLGVTNTECRRALDYE